MFYSMINRTNRSATYILKFTLMLHVNRQLLKTHCMFHNSHLQMTCQEDPTRMLTILYELCSVLKLNGQSLKIKHIIKVLSMSLLISSLGGIKFFNTFVPLECCSKDKKQAQGLTAWPCLVKFGGSAAS